MNVRFEIGNKVERDEIWDYPIPTIREAVTNAICHRDYSHLTNIQIKIFNDSIEIWNPGFLPHGLTVEKLWSGDYSSEPRNVLIAQVMFEMEIIEQYGSGIGRMRDYCLKAGLPEPEIREQAHGTLVVARRLSSLPSSVLLYQE